MVHSRFPTPLTLVLFILALTGCEDGAPETVIEAGPSDSGGGPDSPVDSAADAPEIGTGVVYTEEREVCANRSPTRNLYWGDLHVHTRLSFDAYVNDMRLSPDDAYRFATGEAVWIPPLDDSGEGTTRVQLERPLDFTAVTDHAEFLAEVAACTDPESPVYEAPNCVDFNEGGDASIGTFAFLLTEAAPSRPEDICGEGGIDCQEVAAGVWGELQDSAEAFYDRSEACQFTTFVGYEWSGNPGVSNLHRNVIFRNAVVPPLPISYLEEPTPLGLWQALADGCADAADACDVLSIPHNSNWSDGKLFFVEYPDATSEAEEREQAALRANMEPLVELFQHKGDSECMNGFEGVLGEPDELCDFEKLRRFPFQDCGESTGAGSMAGLGCESRFNYLRFALLEGLREAARLGVNPYVLGFIAGTDTHNAIPGAVNERQFLGHTGSQEDSPEDRLEYDRGGVPGGIINNPGGLTAVWAVENSRDAIFEAMRRRETYGTSGPRLAVRFFGGWGYTDELCARADMLEVSYRGGVPMGGTLPDRPEASEAPVFVVSALRDPGTESEPGTPLQRIQIIKGWVDGDDEAAYVVYDVAGDGANGASVDLQTCEPIGDGFDSLCTTWTDPDFDPAVRAYYYARVVENPTCRWSTHECVALPEADRPSACGDDYFAQTIQERAWSSPIWYTP